MSRLGSAISAFDPNDPYGLIAAGGGQAAPDTVSVASPWTSNYYATQDSPFATYGPGTEYAPFDYVGNTSVGPGWRPGAGSGPSSSKPALTSNEWLVMAGAAAFVLFLLAVKR